MSTADKRLLLVFGWLLCGWTPVTAVNVGPPWPVSSTSPHMMHPPTPVSYQYVGPMVYPDRSPYRAPSFRPNPVGDRLYLTMPDAKLSAHVYVYDVDGTLRADYPLGAASDEHTCDLSTLGSGIYYAHILGEQGQLSYAFQLIKR